MNQSWEIPLACHPFTNDCVEIRCIGAPPHMPHAKWGLAEAAIRRGRKEGRIGRGRATIVEASSGNTGNAFALVCRREGLRLVIIMPPDVPADKLNAIRVVGGQLEVRPPIAGKTSVETARHLGTQDGWYNPDQYAGEWNWQAQLLAIAEPVLMQHQNTTLLFAPAGTMGTCLAFRECIRRVGMRTRVVPVICRPGQAVPGARSLAQIRKDVRNEWESQFAEQDLVSGSRKAAFLLSHWSWQFTGSRQLGPSFGLALQGAFKFLSEARTRGELGQYRDRSGWARVLVFGPDTCQPYLPLYLAELSPEQLAGAMVQR